MAQIVDWFQHPTIKNSHQIVELPIDRTVPTVPHTFGFAFDKYQNGSDLFEYVLLAHPRTSFFAALQNKRVSITFNTAFLIHVNSLPFMDIGEKISEELINELVPICQKSF